MRTSRWAAFVLAAIVSSTPAHAGSTKLQVGDLVKDTFGVYCRSMVHAVKYAVRAGKAESKDSFLKTLDSLEMFLSYPDCQSTNATFKIRRVIGRVVTKKHYYTIVEVGILNAGGDLGEVTSPPLSFYTFLPGKVGGWQL